MKTARKITRETSSQILLFIAILLVLLLSSINIAKYTSPNTVLGINTEQKTESESQQETIFWQELLNKNPEYVPGWIEIGNLDKAKEIDPNFSTL